MGTIIQMAVLVGAALTVVALTVELARRPLVILYALLAVHAWELLSPLPSTRVLGVGVSPADAVNLITCGAAIIRLRRGPSKWQWALIAAIAVVLVGTLRGFLLLGDAALLGFRSELYFLVPALFITTLAPRHVDAVVTAVIRFGGFMAIVAVARWVLLATGVPLASDPASSGYLVARAINAGATLGVAFAAVAIVVRLLAGDKVNRGPESSWFTAVVALGVVLLAQHRSVWVSTVIMLALAYIRLPRMWMVKTAVVVVAAFGVTAVEVMGLGDSGTIAESLAYATSNVGTWEWRVARWSDVWTTHAARGWVAIIFGSGYGYSWVSGEVGVWEYSPHNGFLEVAVRLGLVGATLVFAAYGHALWALWRSDSARAFVCWLWIVGTFIYFLPYSASPLIGIVLGAALLHARSWPRRDGTCVTEVTRRPLAAQ